MPSLEFNPRSSKFAQDPYAIYAQLRDLDEPLYYPEFDLLLLSRHADIAQIAMSPHAVRSLSGYLDAASLKRQQIKANWHDMPFHERFVQFSLLDSDGEIHQRLRRQILPEFTGRAVARLEADILAFVEQGLSQIRDCDKFDFIEDFSAPIPGLVIGCLLGVPAEDATLLRRWSEQIVAYFDVDRSAAKKLAAETASKEFYAYLRDLKHERAKSPRSDLISKMISAEREGAYQGDEFISTCMLILLAGHGSTIDVLGSGMHTLLKHPESMRQLRKRPKELANAIQEIFRFEPPLPFFHRHMVADVDLNGTTYPAGTTFGLLYASANRDPEAFNKPDEFQISRNPNRHLSFGRGVHLCLGNHLARLSMKLIFSTLLNRFKKINLVDDSVIYKRGLSVRGPVALHICLTEE